MHITPTDNVVTVTVTVTVKRRDRASCLGLSTLVGACQSAGRAHSALVRPRSRGSQADAVVYSTPQCALSTLRASTKSQVQMSSSEQSRKLGVTERACVTKPQAPRVMAAM
eukprot:scaffold805_cov251-Pinguiococcus_pyrenoidosus.AAC.8